LYGKTWKTSERKYNVIVEHDVKIPMGDGVLLNGNIFRPDSDEKFPAILGYFPYDMDMQIDPITVDSFSSVTFLHPYQEMANSSIEAGDPYFYARRGYIHILVNVRGTGKSEGKFSLMGPRELQDGYDLIEWIAVQPWCDGNVGMFGVSYFAMVQQMVAMLNPPHLKCLFGPWAATDRYRDWAYHGGILNYGFWKNWTTADLSTARVENYMRQKLGEVAYREAIAEAMEDPDVMAVPFLADVLKNPDEGINPIVVSNLLNPLYNEYWDERRVHYEKIKVPAYIGCCWGMQGLHLPGAFRSWENLDVPKKMILCPPAYLDRPLWQLQYESLRWFDYWMKGIENGIMDEPDIRLFVMNTDDWKEAKEWPLPETKWTPFYLHENGLLWEHEYRVNEGCSSFEDSLRARGALYFKTPSFVEKTEVIGPVSLTLYASTPGNDILWFISLWEINPEGNKRLLTKGWLRGSQRETDPVKSKPWKPYHTHLKRDPLVSGEIYEFNIEILPTANLFRRDSRLELKITCKDDKPEHALQAVGAGHIKSQASSRITVYHNEDYPSHLLLPITKGNVIGTFINGAKPYKF